MARELEWGHKGTALRLTRRPLKFGQIGPEFDAVNGLLLVLLSLSNPWQHEA
jgi:hypothetical protein